MIYKNPDDLTNQEKAILGLNTIKEFFDSLGPTDVYKQIVLEEVMKYVCGENHESSIHLPDEEK